MTHPNSIFAFVNSLVTSRESSASLFNFSAISLLARAFLLVADRLAIPSLKSFSTVEPPLVVGGGSSFSGLLTMRVSSPSLVSFLRKGRGFAPPSLSSPFHFGKFTSSLASRYRPMTCHTAKSMTTATSSLSLTPARMNDPFSDSSNSVDLITRTVCDHRLSLA